MLRNKDNIVQEVQKDNDEEEEETEEQFTVRTLNDGLNVVHVLRMIILFNEQFHIQRNYDDTFIKIQRQLQNSSRSLIESSRVVFSLTKPNSSSGLFQQISNF
ncbi:unnamed protein product [Parnassius mnemosyne]|uniref:Uncharacterized protein n=1 Tax=Parnassius mnemosyne TaxID=213953 RepID=A0AAV1L5D7_9NEOP